MTNLRPRLFCCAPRPRPGRSFMRPAPLPTLMATAKVAPGHARLLLWLALDLLADLSSQYGQTPLYKASFYGRSEVVDRLIAARAMVDAANTVLPRTHPRCHPHARTADAASFRHHGRAIHLCPTRAPAARACLHGAADEGASDLGRAGPFASSAPAPPPPHLSFAQILPSLSPFISANLTTRCL